MVSLSMSVQIRELLQSLGVDETTFALAVGVNGRTVKRWLEDNDVPQKDVRKRLDELERVNEHLYQTFTNATAAQLWLQTDNRYLGGLKPSEALRGGRIDRVEAALVALDYGAFV